jgi:dephospho-CoA kinase
MYEDFRILENKVALLKIRDKQREEEIEHFIENRIIYEARYKFADKLIENQYKLNVKFKKVIQQVNQLKKILA